MLFHRFKPNILFKPHWLLTSGFDSGFCAEITDIVKGQMSTSFDETGQRVHSCTTCSFTARVTSNLRSHVEAKHLAGLMYQCNICHQFPAKTWQTLQGHMRKEHGVTQNTAFK